MEERFSGNKRSFNRRDTDTLKDVTNLIKFRYDALNKAADDNDATRLRLMALKARKKQALENPLIESSAPTYKTLPIS